MRPARAAGVHTPFYCFAWLSRGLRQEDDRESAHGLDLPDDELADVERAMGDDAAEPLPDAPDGTSAIGSVGGPEE